MGNRNLTTTGRVVFFATVAGACAVMWLAARYPWRVPVLSLILAVLASWALGHVQVRLTAERGRISLGFAGVICFALVWGPMAGAVIGLAEGMAGNLTAWLSELWQRRRPARPDGRKIVFNGANHALAGGAAGLVYVSLHHSPGVTTLDASAPPAMAASLVYYLVNTWLTAGMVASAARQPVRKVWRENYEWTLPAFLGMGGIIVLCLASLFHRAWTWTSVVLMPSLYFVWYTYRLYGQKVQVERDHLKALDELNHSIIASLASAINAKDRYTTRHLSRVQCYATAMAEYLGVAHDVREAVRCASLVHDIGKIGVPEYILRKPGALTPEEYRRVQEHVEIGAAILRPVRFPWPVVETVLGHHERWDGKGYPRGLAGENIHIGARILAVADVFDALTSDRPYRKAMALEDALDAMRRMAGAQFDPAVVDALIAVLPACRTRLAEMVDEPRSISDEASGLYSGLAGTPVENTEFLAMYNAGRPLPQTLNLDDTLDAVLERIVGLVPFEDAVLYVPGNDGILRACAAHGRDSEDLKSLRLTIRRGPSRMAFEQRRAVPNGVAIRDIGVHFRSGKAPELYSTLACPIEAGGEVLGVLTLYSDRRCNYTPDHVRLVETIARHASSAIRSALRLQQTEEMAYSDPLTGLPNARALNAWLANRLEQCRDTHEPFAVGLTDLDNFKTVNDTWGHLAGDQVLRDVASAMMSCVRSGDVVARYAGDEFVVGIQSASPEALDTLRRRLSDAVDAVAVARDLPIGASTGIAVYPEDGLSPSELLQVADARMYEEKSRRKRLLAGQAASGGWK